MGLSKDNIYSFDECSVLNLCSIRIPAAYLWAFGKEELKPRNFDKLIALLNALKQKEIRRHRFTPSHHLEQHIYDRTNQLITDTRVQTRLLPRVFKVEVMEQLREFYESLSDWDEISKVDNFQHIKDFFKRNERQLAKAQNTHFSNIPEDDDCQVLGGLIAYPGENAKFLITVDEHFWGYADLIKLEYNVLIVKEWESHKLI